MRVTEWGERSESSPEGYFARGTSDFQAETGPKHCWVWAGLAWLQWTQAERLSSGEVSLGRFLSETVLPQGAVLRQPTTNTRPDEQVPLNEVALAPNVTALGGNKPANTVHYSLMNLVGMPL